MRTPLTVIDATVEGMIDGVLPRDVTGLHRLSAETRRLRRLADDLSALSRAEEGRLDLRPVDADVAAVVATAAERLRAQADDAGIDLVITAPGPRTARVDPDRIAQVVTNLVGNALRATPSGGHVRVEVTDGVDGVTVEVSDDGMGLAAQDLERVFERFYRAHSSASPARLSGETGSGIGLTISRRIVEAHGGSLTAASPGPGVVAPSPWPSRHRADPVPTPTCRLGGRSGSGREVEGRRRSRSRGHRPQPMSGTLTMAR